MNIMLNGVETETDKESLSYDDIVALRDGSPKITYTVTVEYRNERGRSICKGQSVEVKEGMLLNAFNTSNA